MLVKTLAQAILGSYKRLGGPGSRTVICQHCGAQLPFYNNIDESMNHSSRCVVLKARLALESYEKVGE